MTADRSFFRSLLAHPTTARNDRKGATYENRKTSHSVRPT